MSAKTSSPLTPTDWGTAKHVLYIDIETYCNEDLRDCGVYRYAASPSFELLLIGAALDNGPVAVYDVFGKKAPDPRLVKVLTNPSILKVAHNAKFEMVCLAAAGYTILPEQWADSMILAYYAGLPGSLENLSQTLRLSGNAKLATGKALIKIFCGPRVKKGQMYRTTPADEPQRWQEFIEYNKRDVMAEREVFKRLRCFDQPVDRAVYLLDHEINSRGVRIDADLAKAAIPLGPAAKTEAMEELKTLTDLANPNSNKQFLGFMRAQGYNIDSVDKKTREAILESNPTPLVTRVLTLKDRIGRAAQTKYDRALKAVSPDGRLRGAFQYYGSHTGRWAGRAVQLQNLVRNNLSDLDAARNLVKQGDFAAIESEFGRENVTDVLGQLIRTMLLPSVGNKLLVADFSAIEARVIAWLADETWRVNVFAADGDIYKSSYAQAFGVDVNKVTKAQRQIGKVMELALGYGGGVKAMKDFGAQKLGLSDAEMQNLVYKWRNSSPHIKLLWYNLQNAAVRAIAQGIPSGIDKGIIVQNQNGCLAIRLPSGRTLFYQKPRLEQGKYGDQIVFEGVKEQKWQKITTWGGRLSENVVQAIARDCLAIAMLRLEAAGYKIISHVHDEVIIDAPPSAEVRDVERIMGEPIDWAPGLHLTAKGYEGQFYYKD